MVMTAKMQNIELIKFSEFINWDVKRFISKENIFNFPICHFSNVLSLVKMDWVSIENDSEYPILGVHSNGKGVFINRVAKGKELTMRKYQKSKAFHLFFCKVRTVNGQFGVVYPEFENTYGSSNMQYLKIALDKINPKYLELLFSLKSLTDQWNRLAIGADGRHFTLNTLLDLEIPLPPLDDEDAKKRNLPNEITQEKLVATYNKIIGKAEEAKIKAKEKETEIEEYLISVLGISKKQKQVANLGLSFVKFSFIERWDILSLLGTSNIAKSEHSNIKLSKVIKAFNNDLNGTSLRFETYKQGKQDFHYLGMENVERNSGKVIELPIVKGSQVKSQTIKVPSDFLIYGKLRPYLNKYWHNTTQYDNIVCSSEFFVFDIDSTLIDKSYFICVLSSSIIQNQIKDKFSGVRMPRISSTDFYDLQIPLPKDLTLQKNIANTINILRAEIASLLASNIQMQQQALLDFENQIFKHN